jgi:hypothetical protein
MQPNPANVDPDRHTRHVPRKARGPKESDNDNPSEGEGEGEGDSPVNSPGDEGEGEIVV